jgi:ribonuclease Z
MAMSIQILGRRGADNALLVTVDTGQRVSRLLMDCGEDTVSTLTFAESSQIDHVLFSHFHMDHVAGFDSFFRRHYDRGDRVNHLWGPPGTREIMGHRFRSFTWNLVAGRHARWLCHDIFEDAVEATRYELEEAFAMSHPHSVDAKAAMLFRGPGFQVEAITLHHGIPSIGYIVREAERTNIDVEKLHALGLKRGPWLKTLATDTTSVIDGATHDSAALREKLLVRTPGDSMAFLTDFIADSGEEQERIAARLQDIGTLVSECQYRAADEALARKNQHMTTRWVGELASRVSPRRLLLTHFSERYQPEEWDQMVEEVRSIFPKVDVD